MGSNPVTQTAVLKCTYGSAPATVMVQSQFTVNMCGLKAATIMDNKPLNFVWCRSPWYWGPCQAAAQVTAPWVPGSLTVRICGKPAVNKSCKLMCNFGGVIEMNVAPAMTVKIG